MVMRLTNGKVKNFKTEYKRYLSRQGNNNKIKIFVRKTKASYSTARAYLKAYSWDLYKASNKWTFDKYSKKAKKV